MCKLYNPNAYSSIVIPNNIENLHWTCIHIDSINKTINYLDSYFKEMFDEDNSNYC